jgi:trimethylamine:corrinoid methyltransferase-like protein
MPALLDRDYWPTWLAAGRPDTRRRCRERRDALLAAYRPTPISDSVDRDVRRICADARKHLVGG